MQLLTLSRRGRAGHSLALGACADTGVCCLINATPQCGSVYPGCTRLEASARPGESRHNDHGDIYSGLAKEHAMQLCPHWIRLFILVALIAHQVCIAQAPGERE